MAPICQPFRSFDDFLHRPSSTMNRSRVTFNRPSKQQSSSPRRKSSSPRKKSTTHPNDFFESRVWDVQRTKQEFIQQGRFFPNKVECESLLHDLNDHLNYEPGHLNFDDYCEFCKEALRTSGLAPKHEELRQLFDLIDADESKTLERHEILHAVMGDWDVKNLLRGSKTLQPLGSVAVWRRAFEKLEQPDRRAAAVATLFRLSSDSICATTICEWRAEERRGEEGLMRRPMLESLAPLLTVGRGKEMAVNAAGTLGNLAWHFPAIKMEMTQLYYEYFW